MSLAATVLEDAVTIAQERFTRHENRLSDTDVLGIFMDGTNSLVNAAEVTGLRASARRPVKIPVLQRFNPTIRTSRRITESPTMSTSAFVSTSWQTVGFELGVEQAVNVDNYASAAQDLANQIANNMRGIVAHLDNLAVGKLESSKYATPAASSLAGVSVSAGAYTMAQPDFYTNLPAIMKKLNIQGPYAVVSNVESLANITKMSTFSQYNQQFLSQLYEGYNIGYSANITPEDGDIQKSYVLPTGSVGMIQWTEDDCRRGLSYDLLQYFERPFTLTTPKGQTITLNFGVKYEAGPKDLSAKLSGLERAFAESWGLYVDVCFLSEYSSDSTSPIVKFNLPQPV